MCKLGILNAVCKKNNDCCKFYNTLSDECSLYEHLNSEYMKSRELTSRNFFLADILEKD